MSSLKLILLLQLCAASLVACTPRTNIHVGSVPDDYRTNHPIEVYTSLRSFEIPLNSSEKAITQQQRRIIDYALAVYEQYGSGPIWVSVPMREQAGRSVLTLAKNMKSEFRRRGFQTLDRSFQHGNGRRLSVRIEFSVYEARVAKCGNASEDLLSTENNNYSQNFGCSVRSNLAKQIASPRNLIDPPITDSSDPQRRSATIRDYRDAIPVHNSEVDY
ncbi:hypothetical protein CQ054_21920 [Ochrobactrum sp. MYb29]|nr:hypothetical protein CQ054_21920 [Ochrobactrum sp. MYb29]TCQ71857.1 pilus assembly protein CpaD [Ochrobactrum sp. BH3]